MIERVDRGLAGVRAASGHGVGRKVATKLSPTEALELSGLPIPPSVNNLFADAKGRPGGGRVKSERYRGWANAAGWEVRRQALGRRVAGPVTLTYTFEEKATKCDLGNLEKALTDLLVDLQIIDGDDKRIVRRISLVWGHAPGANVRIEPVPRQPALFGVAA